jgi:cell division inhibitor SepF
VSALQRLKAYFGMVPADDIDDYDSDDDYRRGYRADGYRSEYLDDGEYGGYPDRSGSRRRPSTRPEFRDEPGDEDDEYQRRDRGRPRHGWGSEPAVHGSLAVEPRPEPVSRLRPVPEPTPPVSNPLSRIITLNPTSFAEARTIGEHYREGTPVIINLTEMEDADARRLVDFAAGLAFALRGAIDKVTNKVFLISPPNVDVSAEDRRRLAEGGFFARG